MAGSGRLIIDAPITGKLLWSAWRRLLGSHPQEPTSLPSNREEQGMVPALLDGAALPGVRERQRMRRPT